MAKGGMPARNKKNFRPTKKGAGMTEAGVKAYRRLNPGSKLKTAVTGKVKPGSKALPVTAVFNLEPGFNLRYALTPARVIPAPDFVGLKFFLFLAGIVPLEKPSRGIILSP